MTWPLDIGVMIHLFMIARTMMLDNQFFVPKDLKLAEQNVTTLPSTFAKNPRFYADI
jgi:hypothetical protein